MQLEHRAVVKATPERVWAFVMDVPRMAACLPGAEGVTPDGEDAYRGALKVRVGPIGLRLEGRLIVVERDDANYRAALRAEAADKKVSGAVRSGMALSLQPVEAGTELKVVSDVHIMGKLGEFGQPVIRKKADEMMGAFTQNLARALDTQPISA